MGMGKGDWSRIWVGLAGGMAAAAALGFACTPAAVTHRDRRTGQRVNAAPGLEVLVFPPDPASTRAPEGYAIVQDRQEVELGSGVTRLTTQGVPKRLLESTVTFRSFTDPDGTRVRSQR